MPITDARLLSTNVAESDAAVWSAATAYAQGDLAIKLATHRVYRSLQNANLGHDPAAEADPANPVYWQDLRATNAWRMFDGLVGDPATRADGMAIAVAPNDFVDTVALLNVAAASAQVTVTSATEGVIYSRTRSLVASASITDWHEYFFTAPERGTELVFDDLPLYLGARIDIALADVGQTVALGECIVGRGRQIGKTQYGAQLGITDYSVKTADDYGNYTVTERAYARRGSFSLLLDGRATSGVHALLARYRATPALWLGVPGHDAAAIYGYYRDFDVAIAYPNESLCTIEIDGLT